MGGNTTRANVNASTAAKDARSVLTRAVMQPLMKAIAPLAKAEEAAADPDQIRQIARQRADDIDERAKQQGQALLEAARLQAKQLRAGASRQRRELLVQAENDVRSVFERREVAYQAALDAGWTRDLLREVGYEPSSPRPPRRARRRRAPADGTSAATSDTAESAGPMELPANAPT